MKTHEILIIGSAPLTHSLYAGLINKKKDVGMVDLPDDPETLLARESLAFRSHGPVDPQKIESLLRLNLKISSGKLEIYPGPGKFLDEWTFQTKEETIRASKIIIFSGCLAPQDRGIWPHVPRKTPLEILSDPAPSGPASVTGSGLRAFT